MQTLRSDIVPAISEIKLHMTVRQKSFQCTPPAQRGIRSLTLPDTDWGRREMLYGPRIFANICRASLFPGSIFNT